MNTKRIIFLCCICLVCAGMYANTYSDDVLVFDYPDDFLLEKNTTIVGLRVMAYTSAGDAVAEYGVTKNVSFTNLTDDKLPSRLNAMHSSIIRKLADMTDYKSVKFGKLEPVTLTHIHGVQQTFEETTADGSILKGKAFIAVEGWYFFEALLLTADEKYLNVLDESLQSVRFGKTDASQHESIAESSQAEEVDGNTQDDKNIVFIVVEQMPEFPGGQQGLFAYLSENVKYPLVAKENNIQGRVICNFVVEKDGRITDVQVVRSGGDPSLDKEAVRVLSSMPNWKPGKQRGKPVRVKYVVPITFKL